MTQIAPMQNNDWSRLMTVVVTQWYHRVTTTVNKQQNHNNNNKNNKQIAQRVPWWWFCGVRLMRTAPPLLNLGGFPSTICTWTGLTCPNEPHGSLPVHSYLKYISAHPLRISLYWYKYCTWTGWTCPNGCWEFELFLRIFKYEGKGSTKAA